MTAWRLRICVQDHTVPTRAVTGYHDRMQPTHYDLLVVIAIIFAIGLSGLVILGWMAWSSHRTLSANLAECQRLTRAVGVLILQEEDKTRALFRDLGR